MKKELLICALTLGMINLNAQTNPEPYKLRGGDYEFLGFEDNANPNYPVSIQGWQGNQLTTQPTAPTTEQPNGDEPLCINCATDNNGSSINNGGVNGMAMRRMASNAPGKPISICLALNTIGCKKVSISWEIKMVRDNSLCIANLALQYRIGTTGNWKNVADNEYNTGGGQGKVFPFYQLPTEVEEKPVVQLRWYYYAVNNNTTMPRVGLTNIKVKAAEVAKIPVAKFDFSYDGPKVVFSDKSINNPGSWFWKFGDGDTTSMQNPDHVYLKDTTYEVVLIVQNAIGTDSIKKTVVYPNPDTTAIYADFTYTIDSFTVSFLNSSLNAKSYAWDFGDASNSVETDPIHVYAGAGEYNVQLISNNEFNTDTVFKTITIEGGPIGIKNLKGKNAKLNVFPNPASTSFKINANSTISEIEMVNLLGEKVLHLKGLNALSVLVNSIKLKAGFYILNVTTNEGLFKESLILK